VQRGWSDGPPASAAHSAHRFGQISILPPEPAGKAAVPIPVQEPESTTMSGRPLPDELRARMEGALGANLLTVRIHEGDHVSRMGARALAHGEDIHFAPDAYQPQTAAGRAELGHELIHVLQQRTGRARAAEADGEPLHDSTLEIEAGRQGARAAAGEAVGLPGASTAPPVANRSPSPVQGIWVRMDPHGKVHYQHSDDAAQQSKHHVDYFSIPDDKFAIWKGAGKRTESRKVTDPKTGKSYYHDKTTGTFYHWDRTKTGGQGEEVDNGWLAHYWGNNSQSRLKARLATGELIDRRRDDRTAKSSPLLPFDVGSYSRDVVHKGKTLAHRLPTADGVWNANNDHIPSGQSLKDRNQGDASQDAYAEGAVIAIPAQAHKDHSPTYGGRQKTTDQEPGSSGKVGSKRTRESGDADHPGRAVHRDTLYMLDQTKNQDYSGTDGGTLDPKHKDKLNLNKPESRLRQMGAYRSLYRINVKFHQHLGQDRGFDPDEAAQEFGSAPTKAAASGHVGQFKHHRVEGRSQGEQIRNKFRRLLEEEKFTNKSLI